ncbi:MAG TPA: hypothetical protein VGI88_04460 [Verrucomicrobiae bacterium]|jgi:hypothetical protein
MKIGYIIVLVLGLAFRSLAEVTNAAPHSVFHDYDQAVLTKISGRWYGMMDAVQETQSPAGKAVLEFRVFPDGHVGDLKVDSSTVGGNQVALCKKAILDSAPFPKWTKEIREGYTNDFRVIHFTFSFR